MKIHEAQFSDVLIDPIVGIFDRHQPNAGGGIIVDPFGGLGWKFAGIAERLGYQPVAFEIEPGYMPYAHPCVSLGDSRHLPLGDASVDGALSSPAYPNGMADNFKSSSYDASTRHTYIHNLRAVHGPDYELQPGNAAGVGSPRSSKAALERMYAIHRAVWAEVLRVLKPGAIFVVNTKSGKIPFTEHTQAQLREAGFEIVETLDVGVRGHNHQEHHGVKQRHETLTVAGKPT